MDTMTERQGGVGWLDLLGKFDITGGDIGSEADVMKLADGVDFNAMFAEIRDLLSVWNQNLDSLVSLITYRTISPAESVIQKGDGARLFEKASEFGVPKGAPIDPALLLGFDYEDYDVASRWSWKYLRNATQAEIRNSVDNILAGHSQTVVAAVLQRLFDNTQISTPEGNISYGLWAGDMKPLPFMGKTFAADHSHYLLSGAATLDSEDLESVERLITEHGYGKTQGSKLLLLVSDLEAETISSFRAGVINNNTKVAKYDFIASSSAPSYLTDKNIVGAVAPGDVAGIECIGSYGRFYVCPHNSIPEGYVAAVASAGAGSPQNPVGYREHSRPEWRGLRMLPGNWGGYPLVESFHQFGMGTGVRNRGAGAVLQLGTGPYVVPQIATT
ncbi:hypothetical protein BH09ACT7_BH09ACT7_37570 [soil metagenome]